MKTFFQLVHYLIGLHQWYEDLFPIGSLLIGLSNPKDRQPLYYSKIRFYSFWTIGSVVSSFSVVTVENFQKSPQNVWVSGPVLE